MYEKVGPLTAPIAFWIFRHYADFTCVNVLDVKLKVIYHEVAHQQIGILWQRSRCISPSSTSPASWGSLKVILRTLMKPSRPPSASRISFSSRTYSMTLPPIDSCVKEAQYGCILPSRTLGSVRALHQRTVRQHICSVERVNPGSEVHSDAIDAGNT